MSPEGDCFEMEIDMNEKWKKTIARYVICILGIMMTSLSAAIFQLLSLGSDPMQVLMSGLANAAGISYGTAIFGLNLALACFMVIFARKYVKAALVLSVLCAGVFVDGYLGILSKWISADMPFPVKVVLGMAGCLIMCIGIYVYLLPELGASPTEGIGLYIAEKSKTEYGKVRLALDILFTIIGWLLGGNFGLITVFAMLTTGPAVGLLERIFHHSLVKAE